MFKKNCRLTRASRYFMGGGGGGGSSSVQYRNPAQEKKTVGNWYDFQQNRLNDYVSGNPLVQSANTGAQNFWSQLPGMLGQFPGFGKELQGQQGQLQDLYGQQGGLFNKLGAQAGTLGGWLAAPGGPSSIIASQGALTPQMSRDVAQQTRGIASDQGTVRGPGALGQELLNRDAYRQQRYNTALQQGQGLLQQQAGDYSQQAGVTGLQQGNLGQQSGLVGQRAGLLGQEQGMQTAGLNQLLGVQSGNVSGFTGLQNPILSYLGSLFGGNQAASIAQSQIAAQQQQASSSKSSGLMAGGASIVGALAIAL